MNYDLFTHVLIDNFHVHYHLFKSTFQFDISALSTICFVIYINIPIQKIIRNAPNRGYLGLSVLAIRAMCSDNEFALNYIRMVSVNPIGIKIGLKD